MEKQIRKSTHQLLEHAKDNPRQWPQLFSHNPAEPLPPFANRRQVLLSLARSLDTTKDKELAKYVVEEEIKLFEEAEHAKTMQNTTRFTAPLQICCFILSRFHDKSNVWLIWRAIRAANETREPLRTEYLYLGGSSPATSMKDTIDYVTRNKDSDKKELKEQILKQIQEDIAKGFTQASVDKFWQDFKHTGWKTELMLDVPSFPEEKVNKIDPENFLADMQSNPDKWPTLLGYRHTLKDGTDANFFKRLLLMIELTKHVHEIHLYEELVEYVFDQDCQSHTMGYEGGVNGSMHVAAYLICCLGKIENVFKVWRSKNTSFDSCFVQHAEYLYVVGYTPDSKTTLDDTLDFVNKCDPKKFPEKESLLYRFAYDGRIGWRTQEKINTFWKRREQPGFWNFARFVDGGWG